MHTISQINIYSYATAASGLAQEYMRGDEVVKVKVVFGISNVVSIITNKRYIPVYHFFSKKLCEAIKKIW
jgi:superfamily II RNA helicase